MSTPPSAAPTRTQEATRPTDSGDQVVGARLSERLRRWRPFLAAGLLFVLVALATLWTGPRVSKIPYAIDNPHNDGAQALAELLRDEGVEVTSVGSTEEAFTAASEGATVVVLNAGNLRYTDRWQLAQMSQNVVVLGSLYQDLSGLTEMTSTGVSADTALKPECTDPDAVAAEALAGSTGSVSVNDAAGAVGCFPVGEDAYAYATAELAGGGTLRVIADPRIVANANLTTAGNAALAVRALGHSEHLVWLDASQTTTVATLWDNPRLPPWLPVMVLLAVIVVVVLALVRGRRFGRLVSEDLPVVVRATETAVGRGRLYRCAGDRGRAAQALRAGTALRLGRALGLPSSASRGELLQAAERAGGRSTAEIDHALYGPIPANDQALADLAVHLEQIESEVHQR